MQAEHQVLRHTHLGVRDSMNVSVTPRHSVSKKTFSEMHQRPSGLSEVAAAANAALLQVS